MTASFSIQTVSERTGLSPHVIRAWERRYGAIEPERTAGKHRVYSEEEIERLDLLREAVEAGHSIGTVATLATEDLRSLGRGQSTARTAELSSVSAAPFRKQALEGVASFNLRAIQEAFDEAALRLGNQGLLRQVIAPLAREVGELWREGSITVAHEHFFTAIVKVFLGNITRKTATPPYAPLLIVCTPVGQAHELGAVIIATEATNLGWLAIYLGPNLPAIEIAGASLKNKAAAVALSIVYPEDDPTLDWELTEVARLLPQGTHLVVGGRSAKAYLETLTQIGAHYADSLEEFGSHLDAIRRSPKPSMLQEDEDSRIER